jgi:glycine dehydrogenase subunit 2
MKSIAAEAEQSPEIIVEAPHNTRISRLDETTAARKPILRWKPQSEAAAK